MEETSSCHESDELLAVENGKTSEGGRCQHVFGVVEQVRHLKPLPLLAHYAPDTGRHPQTPDGLGCTQSRHIHESLVPGEIDIPHTVGGGNDHTGDVHLHRMLYMFLAAPHDEDAAGVGPDEGLEVLKGAGPYKKAGIDDIALAPADRAAGNYGGDVADGHLVDGNRHRVVLEEPTGDVIHTEQSEEVPVLCHGDHGRLVHAVDIHQIVDRRIGIHHHIRLEHHIGDLRIDIMHVRLCLEPYGGKLLLYALGQMSAPDRNICCRRIENAFEP